MFHFLKHMRWAHGRNLLDKKKPLTETDDGMAKAQSALLLGKQLAGKILSPRTGLFDMVCVGSCVVQRLDLHISVLLSSLFFPLSPSSFVCLKMMPFAELTKNPVEGFSAGLEDDSVRHLCIFLL